MKSKKLNIDDKLEDFEQRSIAFDKATKKVNISGNGPAEIVMTELLGISPHIARFSRWIIKAGISVYMPSLFGRDGVVVSAEEGAEVFKRACMIAEFKSFESN